MGREKWTVCFFFVVGRWVLDLARFAVVAHSNEQRHR